MRYCLFVLVLCTYLSKSTGQFSQEGCPSEDLRVNDCSEVDVQISGGLSRPLKGLRSCRAVYLNPNAVFLCREYRSVSNVCPCVCKIVLCDYENLDREEKEVEPDDTGDMIDLVRKFVDQTPQYFCFSGDDTVQTKTGGETAMASIDSKPDLAVEVIDDQGKLGFETMDRWLHRDESVTAEFYTLRTESGHAITLTPTHLIYKVSCEEASGAVLHEAAKRLSAVWAKNVKRGDCLLVKNAASRLVPSAVARITRSKKQGIYLLLTRSGSIMVNGVAASNYAITENERLAIFLANTVETLTSYLPTWAMGGGSSAANSLMFMTPLLDRLSKVLITLEPILI